MTTKISTPLGDMYRTASDLPLRHGERAIYETAADVALPQVLALISECHDYFGEEAVPPEDLRWRITVRDMRSRSR